MIAMLPRPRPLVWPPAHPALTKVARRLGLDGTLVGGSRHLPAPLTGINIQPGQCLEPAKLAGMLGANEGRIAPCAVTGICHGLLEFIGTPCREFPSTVRAGSAGKLRYSSCRALLWVAKRRRVPAGYGRSPEGRKAWRFESTQNTMRYRVSESAGICHVRESHGMQLRLGIVVPERHEV